MERLVLGWLATALLVSPAWARQNDDLTRPYLKAAVNAATWIRADEVKTDGGRTWPIAPERSPVANSALYHGSSGVVLFFLELHAATNAPVYLADALSGADYLIGQIPNTAETVDSGLYTGLAGIAFVLEEVHKAGGGKKYRDAALRCVDLIVRHAKQAGRGVEWNNSPDIIGGGAGIGLFLLYAAREMERPELIELAKRAGRRIIELGQPQKSGLMWPIATGSKRNMPNFSHGAAGASYFLATLYQRTREKEFLDAALLGGRYLMSVADAKTCLIFHDDPGGTERYYLGWCHGPPGTARLFHRLAEVTRDKSWSIWLGKSARGLMQSGIPSHRTGGFWNNVGQCCGSAGVADFMIDLHRQSGEAAYLDFARLVTADLLKRATRDASGLRWIHAEHRVRPKDLAAQTGYMQGAAGIGMLLLHLDGQDRGRTRQFVFPDSPF